MADSVSAFQGLASGVQWRDMIDQIMNIETSRQLTPVTNEISATQSRADAWAAYGVAATKLGDAAKALRDATAFGAMKLSAPASSLTSRTLLSVAGGAGASPGSYRVEVQSLARAERLGGALVADPAAPLGTSGEIRINGRAVRIDASDTLNAVRDKINAVNTGTSASRVTASVLTVAGKSRLVLTSDATGAAGIELNEVRASDAAPRVLAQLGLVDDAVTQNVGADGMVRSGRLTSLNAAAYVALGVQTSPAPATLVVNGHSFSVDPSTQSIADIVALINANSPGAAKTETTTENGATSHRLAIAGTVAGGDAAGDRLLEAMGLTVRGRAAAAQQVTTGAALTGADGNAATAATLLTDVGTGGSAAGLQAGDTFTIAGATGDGVAVRTTFTVADGATLGDLTSAIKAAYDAAGRDVTVGIDGGRIVVTDGATGDSRLTLSLTAGLQSGTLDLGGTTTDYGRQRTLAAGADARVLVDGALVTRASNTITDAIGGVTLSLQQAEPGTEIAVDVARDPDAVVKAAQDFAKAFNDLVAFAEKETRADGRLPFNGALRSNVQTLKSALLADVAGIPATAAYKRPGAVGVALSKSGTLEVDAAALKQALALDPAGVQAVFAAAGKPASGAFQHVYATDRTQPGSYDVAVTRAATRSTAIGAALATYDADAGADTMTLTDSVSGKTKSISLVSGDNASTVAEKLNALFASEKMRLSASVEGGALRLTHLDYGSAPAFTVAYASDDASDPAAQLGLAAGEYRTGVDVAGTITTAGGTAVPATGVGQTLTGKDGTAAEGLSIRYLGTADSATTTYAYALGIGGLMARLAARVSGPGGFATAQADATAVTIERLTKRGEDVQARLERQRDSLLKRYAAMEEAMSRITAQGNWLTSQVKALQSSNE